MLDRLLLTTLVTASFIGCGGEVADIGSDTGQESLTGACFATRNDVPADGWICGEDLVVECASTMGTDVPTIHVVEADLPTASMLCGSGDLLEPSDIGPFAPGEHTIEVDRVDGAGARTTLCSSTLTVQDTLPPEVEAVDLELWPPNHKYRHVTPEDCVVVTDQCDDDVEAVFLWASSDEPAEGRGDGNHEPDIRDLTCDGVDLRAERSGNENGRVYKLGVRVFDDDGNHADATCVIAVTHDRRGTEAIDDGESYRVELAEDACGETGGGETGGGGSGGGGETGGSGSETGGGGGSEGPALPPNGF